MESSYEEPLNKYYEKNLLTKYTLYSHLKKYEFIAQQMIQTIEDKKESSSFKWSLKELESVYHLTLKDFVKEETPEYLKVILEKKYKYVDPTSSFHAFILFYEFSWMLDYSKDEPGILIGRKTI